MFNKYLGREIDFKNKNGWSSFCQSKDDRFI